MAVGAESIGNATGSELIRSRERVNGGRGLRAVPLGRAVRVQSLERVATRAWIGIAGVG